MSRFDEIKAGLMEAIAYERGELSEGVRVHKMTISEVKDFSPAEVKKIRMNAGMTQNTFAVCLGVSKKSVEAWEGGRSRPDGPARRLIGLMERDPKFAYKSGIIME